MTGGYDGSILSSTEIYVNSVWSYAASLPSPRYVFSAATVDGRVHVFDLKVDKYHAICSQKILSNRHTGLNHLSFNPQYPVVNVGDDK